MSYPQFLPVIPSHARNPEHSGMPVCVDSSPYPEVQGGRDPRTVALLKDDYAGPKGELTAITQYVFQNGRSENDAFANSVLQIAIVEMMHLDMLGDAIVALGGNPSFDDGQTYWCACNVNYASDLEEMLKANIAAERNAIASYEKHAALTCNESVKALLERIAKDEKLHLRFYTETLQSLK